MNLGFGVWVWDLEFGGWSLQFGILNFGVWEFGFAFLGFVI